MGRLLLPEITEQLIEARGNLDLQHENVATPLTIAADRGHDAVAQLLLAEDGKQGSRTSLQKGLENICRHLSITVLWSSSSGRIILIADFSTRRACA